MARGWQKLHNIPDFPGSLFDPNCTGRSSFQGLMHSAKVVVHEVQGN
jgi:hypothetical protein